MSDENTEASMQSPPAATGTRVVVIRRWIVTWNRWKSYAILALLNTVIGIGTVAVGIVTTCDSDDIFYDCDNEKKVYIIFGSCLLFVAACFLVVAIVLYKKMKTTIRLEQSSSVIQPVTVTPSYLCQPVIAFPTVTTQYPPPYHPPTGPNNIPLSPAANQYSPPAGFTASSQPTKAYVGEATEPPGYSP